MKKPRVYYCNGNWKVKTPVGGLYDAKNYDDAIRFADRWIQIYMDQVLREINQSNRNLIHAH